MALVGRIRPGVVVRNPPPVSRLSLTGATRGLQPFEGPSSMAELVNLRKARKAAARRQEEARAAENRLAYGRSKAERALDQARSDKSSGDLDAHRIETEDGR